MVLNGSLVVAVDGWDLYMAGRLLLLKEYQELANQFEVSLHHTTKLHIFLLHTMPTAGNGRSVLNRYFDSCSAIVFARSKRSCISRLKRPSLLGPRSVVSLNVSPLTLPVSTATVTSLSRSTVVNRT